MGLIYPASGVNVAIPNEVCIAPSRLFALFKPVILKLPRVSLHYSALPSLSATRMRHRGDRRAEPGFQKLPSFLTSPGPKHLCQRVGEEWAAKFQAGMSPGTAVCPVGVHLSRLSPVGRPTSGVLLSLATLPCNLSIIRRRNGKQTSKNNP